ncbi:exported hypothetical protein [Streptomyces misionensis JCM 4497]
MIVLTIRRCAARTSRATATAISVSLFSSATVSGHRLADQRADPEKGFAAPPHPPPDGGRPPSGPVSPMPDNLTAASPAARGQRANYGERDGHWRQGQRGVPTGRAAPRPSQRTTALVRRLGRARPAQPVPLAVPRAPPDLLPAFVGDFAPHWVHTGRCASRIRRDAVGGARGGPGCLRGAGRGLGGRSCRPFPAPRGGGAGGHT